MLLCRKVFCVLSVYKTENASFAFEIPRLAHMTFNIEVSYDAIQRVDMTKIQLCK